MNNGKINWSAAEIRITLRGPGPKAQEKVLAVYPDFGSPKLRMIQSLQTAVKGPLVWIVGETDSGRTVPVPFGDSLGVHMVGSSGEGNASNGFADLIDELQASPKVKRVLVYGADRVEHSLEVKCLGDETKDALGDVSDRMAPGENNDEGGLRDEF